MNTDLKYKHKLRVLLQALEVENIDDLIEKPALYLMYIGQLITEAAKLGVRR